MLDMNRGERELSNGRLGSAIGDIRGNSTPNLAGLNGKFSFVSRQIALLGGRRCQNWTEESEGYPTVLKSRRLDDSTINQLFIMISCPASGSVFSSII